MTRPITILNDNYIDLDNLPKLVGGKIDWFNSVGYELNFKYCDIIGILKIIKVERKNKATILNVNYNGTTCNIHSNDLRMCKLNKIIRKNDKSLFINWKYNIGENVVKDIYILDRKFDNSIQYYKIICKKCGFKSQSHYITKGKKSLYKNEYWIDGTYLSEFKDCPCCSESRHSIIVKGINDIATTDQWMVRYFSDKTNAYKYSSGSHSKILMKCPDCNTERIYQISNLKFYKHLPCSCGDNISFPNKIAYYLFKDLKDIYDYTREYNPDWLKPYFYDNYFKYKNKEYIIEMDGALGHGNKSFGSNDKDVEGLKRDKLKDELAKEHNITVIRIDSTKSDFEYIKGNIIKSIGNLLDLSDVDWNKIHENSTHNIVKEICIYANKHYTFNGDRLKDAEKITEISLKFHVCRSTVIRYLKRGRNFGWCEYITFLERSKIITDKVYNMYIKNRNLSYKQIADTLNIEIWDVANATTRLIKKNKIISTRGAA